MRIVFLIEQFPPHVWDGIGSYTSNVSRALAAIGHEVHVLCAKGFSISDEVIAGVHVHRRPPLRIPVTKLLGPWGARFAQPRDGISHRISLALSYAFWLRVLNLRPDVIETQEGETRAIFNALRNDVPLLIHLHTPTMLDLRLRYGKLSLKGRLADALDRYSARHADGLTSPSSLLVDTLRAHAWLPDREVTVIPLPFDTAPFAQMPDATTTAPTILAVGRLEWRKAPDTLLEAVGLLGQRGIRAKLVFAGRSAGEIEGEAWDTWLERRARVLGVECEFAGQLNSEQVQRLYGEARVVAVPSRFDNFPMVALEAMACARPVVVSTCCGLASLVENSGGGTVVPVDAAAELADALAPFLTDAAHAAAVGARGRAGMSVLEPTRIAKLREQAYKCAIEAHRARSGPRDALNGHDTHTETSAPTPTAAVARTAQ